MARFRNLGMKLDTKQRMSHARVDNDRQKQKIASARNIIYEKGYAVDSQTVDDILKDESWVPTFVSSNVVISSK
jgi:hypothetical protein